MKVTSTLFGLTPLGLEFPLEPDDQPPKLEEIIVPFHEKTNIMDSAECIDLDQPAQSTQANLCRHIPSQGDIVIEE